MDDETFNKFIVYDEAANSDKENDAMNSTRQPKTTQNQFDMIASFMEHNNEELIDKDTFGKLWDGLAAKLNDVGPPEHTVVEWKKVWSAHKYYKNRKRTSDVSLRIDKPRKSLRLEQSSQSGIDVEDVEKGAVETYETVHGQSQFLNKLDVFIENQNAMILNQKAIIRELTSSKILLEEIAKKA